MVRGFSTSDLDAGSLRAFPNGGSKHKNKAKLKDGGPTLRTKTSRAEKIARYEFAVNNGYLKPRMEVMLEFDCELKLARTLSVSVRNGGRVREDKSPSDWAVVEAEGLGASLYYSSCT